MFSINVLESFTFNFIKSFSTEVLIGYGVFLISFLIFLILVFTNLSHLIKQREKVKMEEKQIEKIEKKVATNKPILVVKKRKDIYEMLNEEQDQIEQIKRKSNIKKIIKEKENAFEEGIRKPNLK